MGLNDLRKSSAPIPAMISRVETHTTFLQPSQTHAVPALETTWFEDGVRGGGVSDENGGGGSYIGS